MKMRTLKKLHKNATPETKTTFITKKKFDELMAQRAKDRKAYKAEQELKAVKNKGYNPNRDPDGRFGTGPSGSKSKGSSSKKDKPDIKSSGKELSKVMKMKQTSLKAQGKYNEKLNAIREAHYKAIGKEADLGKSNALMGDWFFDSYSNRSKMEKAASQSKSGKGILAEEYKLTQAAYKASGKKTITLYRGVAGKQGKSILKSSSSSVQFKADDASSWSDAKVIATRFAKDNGGVVVKREVPIENVVTSWQVNPYLNNGGENEFIVSDSKSFEVEVL